MSLEIIGVSKKFNIGFKKEEGALGRLVSFISGQEAKKEINVLNDISFKVLPGEIFGLIGKNGSGKTTLLRIIAGIYQPDSGRVAVKGRVDYLSGLSNGLSHRLTMKENIYLMSALLGLEKKDVDLQFGKIVEFSGLSDFLHTKVYQFSSGMITRLCFSVTMHCFELRKSDVLLLDEVFGSGGDIDFEQKAAEKITSFINSGSAVILASHNLKIIEKYCGQVLHLGKGKVLGKGDAKEIIESYKKTLQ